MSPAKSGVGWKVEVMLRIVLLTFDSVESEQLQSAVGRYPPKGPELTLM